MPQFPWQIVYSPAWCLSKVPNYGFKPYVCLPLQLQTSLRCDCHFEVRRAIFPSKYRLSAFPRGPSCHPQIRKIEAMSIEPSFSHGWHYEGYDLKNDLDIKNSGRNIYFRIYPSFTFPRISQHIGSEVISSKKNVEEKKKKNSSCHSKFEVLETEGENSLNQGFKWRWICKGKKFQSTILKLWANGENI